MICPRCARQIPDDALLCCYCGRSIVKKQPSKKHARSNGSGTAFKRGKTWTAQITVGWTLKEDGTRRQRYRTKGGFRTKNEALDYLPILRAGTEYRKTHAPSLLDYWSLYEKNEYDKLSDSKRTAYKIAWKKLSILKDRPVNSLTVQDLRETVNASAKTYYPARDMKMVLKHLFKLAGADGWVSKDLPDYIILPDMEEKERQPFTEDEQRALWALYESGDSRAAIPLIMIYTGMMPGEMQNLKCDMIDLASQQIIGVGMKTKVRKASPVYLPDAIIPVLEEEMRVASSKNGYVWNRNEKRFYENYYAALEAAGCRRLEPYCCRHTTATALAITENIAPRTIQKVMRWSSTKMLDRYAHPDDAAALDAVNRIKGGSPL